MISSRRSPLTMDAVAVRRPSLTVQQQQQQQPGVSSDRTRLTTGWNVNADVRRACSSSIDLRHCHGEPASSPLSFERFMPTHWDCAQTWSYGVLATMSEMRQLRDTVLQKTGYCDQLMSNRKKYEARAEKWALNWFLKFCRESDDRIVAGSLFRDAGPATANARSPKFVFEQAMSSAFDRAELRDNLVQCHGQLWRLGDRACTRLAQARAANKVGRANCVMMVYFI